LFTGVCYIVHSKRAHLTFPYLHLCTLIIFTLLLIFLTPVSPPPFSSPFISPLVSLLLSWPWIFVCSVFLCFVFTESCEGNSFA
jgi:hypothetical protein